MKEQLIAFQTKIRISLLQLLDDTFTLKELEELENEFQTLLKEFNKTENIENYINSYEFIIKIENTLRELRATFK